MLAIDTSGSMAATDVSPEPARRRAGFAARRFIEGLPKGLKIGVLSFDTSARVLVAPTSDHAAGARRRSNSLTIGGGTATGVAIDDALDAVSALPAGADGQKAPAAIVLMSDGSPTIGKDGESIRSRRSPRRRRRRQGGAGSGRHDRVRDGVGHGHDPG